MRMPWIAALAPIVVGCGGGGSTGTKVFTTLAVAPTSGTIAPSAPGNTIQLAATPKDQGGGTMSGLGTPTWTSSDEGVATVSTTGLVTGVAVGGPVTITASLTATGVTRQGSATITVAEPPLAAGVTATTGNKFDPQTVTIKAGGTVTWTFQAVTHTVTFDTPKPAGTPSDIPATSSTQVARDFTTAGTFPYHCTIHAGMTGTVVVVP